MIGSKALSWSCPASAAMVTVRSLPMTSKATWLTTSGMTGLTLPGMMLEPACTAGRLISLKPARGPEDSSRRSLQIFDSFTATRLSTPDSWTKAPASWVASTRSRRGHQRDAGDLRSSRARAAGSRGGALSAGADRGAAEVDLVQQRRASLEPVLVLAERDRVGAELLAQGHRHGVLQLGAADLEHVGELGGLAANACAQRAHASSSSARRRRCRAILIAVG